MELENGDVRNAELARAFAREIGEARETVPRDDHSKLASRLHSFWRTACAFSNCKLDIFKTLLTHVIHACYETNFVQLHKKFVQELQWVDEQTYQELFAISQALPGPGSTKMMYSINVIRGGFGAGFLALALWCLPGALGMYGLSLGIAKVSDVLPHAVYALLSGLNAGTVGIILLAAVQLSEKAITDKLTRIIVCVAGAVGMLYTALWYFPVLMVIGGLATIIWDLKCLQRTRDAARRKGFWRKKKRGTKEQDTEAVPMESVESQQATPNTSSSSHDGRGVTPSHRHVQSTTPAQPSSASSTVGETPSSESHIIPPHLQPQAITWKTGLYLLAGFLISFVTLMIIRGTLTAPPLALRLFTNLYLAGTIIFGGGPVVIPLLREYVVAEGWVSPRDFLLGLAIIQAFPGPNFNFAVYLGSLALMNSSISGPGAAVGFLGAILGIVAIFTPGIWIVTGFMGLWRVLRSKRWMNALLRGVNAAAVGLVWTAVYKLSSIGFIDADHSVGASLGNDPWWVAVTAGAFVGGRWFGVNAPAAIICSGVAGLLWFAVVKV